MGRVFDGATAAPPPSKRQFRCGKRVYDLMLKHRKVIEGDYAVYFRSFSRGFQDIAAGIARIARRKKYVGGYAKALSMRGGIRRPIGPYVAHGALVVFDGKVLGKIHDTVATEHAAAIPVSGFEVRMSVETKSFLMNIEMSYFGALLGNDEAALKESGEREHDRDVNPHVREKKPGGAI
ncbi:hypothetical protein CYMTET_52917 [Cymbomonas tetramitiformis]|uniref:Uncharacterized protein n=1 Tax=Cymbomonas tetramitiformis TaxID=36881 RepID=A0AAE0ES94_9CHLO|nr:hypothetical protein CYMTET_52917 [Cymbomonas tetramitiformis]